MLTYYTDLRVNIIFLYNGKNVKKRKARELKKTDKYQIGEVLVAIYKMTSLM